MSVLSRKELRITLCPGHVALLASVRRLGWQGVRHELVRQAILPVTGEADLNSQRRPHDRVLRLLDACLPDFVSGRTQATVILSNHFVRYVLVPWSDRLGKSSEQLAYARHLFAEVYGDTVRHWEIRLSPGEEGEPQLASAVDERLLAALRLILARREITPVSIQPYLMAAYNGAYPALRRRSAWLALVEPGKLCLGLLVKGGWRRLRSQRIGADWQEEMPRILEREACLLDLDEQPEEALLIAPQAGPLQLPAETRWAFRRLDVASSHPLPSPAWGLAGLAEGAS